MTYRVYLSPPDVGELEEEYALDALKSGWVAPLGPHVLAFEREIADYVGVEHAVALSSGTAGLHLALLSLGVGPGDDVVVPTLTFAATAFAVTYVGATPIFIDSESTSWNIDPGLLAGFLSERSARGALPAAVVVVDIFGQTADYERIESICAEFSVPIIEDAAEALGARHRQGMAGTFGRAAVFSFNGNKIMTTSGGGMLVTDDARIADRAKYLASQAREPVPWYEHLSVGFNYRLSNVLAAIGRAQLARLPEMVEQRQRIRSDYADSLLGLGGSVMGDAPWGRGNAWLSLLMLPDAPTAARVRRHMDAARIESRPVWKPLHAQPVFATCERVNAGIADDFFERTICLPSGSALTMEEFQETVTTIRAALGGTHE
jgi:dTDP-4-amino-4,6-dideoxygalactose transaminase